jgi:hypothetical protein
MTEAQDFAYRTQQWRAELQNATEDARRYERQLADTRLALEHANMRIAEARRIIARREAGIDT